MTDHPFEASNGLWITPRHDHVSWHSGQSRPKVTAALREYFQHQRDQQLGRVRWPENPDIVIYRNEDGDAQGVGRSIFVIDESTGNNEPFYEHLVDKPAYEFEQAAHWYFTEGPGKKPERPWEDAQPGEVWRLTVDGEEGNYVKRTTTFSGGPYKVTPDYTGITAGRKLLNADGSLAE